MWPPPAEFVDPFLTSVRRNQEVDLGWIVDDIMGPNPRKRTGHTPSSFSSGREADRSAGAGGHGVHHESGSGSSYARLLDEFGAGSSPSTPAQAQGRRTRTDTTRLRSTPVLAALLQGTTSFRQALRTSLPTTWATIQ